MIKLSKKDYFKVLPLVNEVPFNNLFARVVAEGTVDGQIFVDNHLKPTVCYIINKYGMSLLCGNYKNDVFNNSFVRFLNNPSQNTKGKWMLFYPSQWESVFVPLLNSHSINQTQRVNFKFCPELFPNEVKPPDGFIIKRIDEDVYENIQGSVIPEYFWNSKAHFLQKGIGFSLMYNDKVVSSCFSSLVVGNKLELGVETSKEFRNRGLSIYAAVELIRYCLGNSYEPVWACRLDNIGSFRLAQKLGFRPDTHHVYYCLP